MEANNLQENNINENDDNIEKAPITHLFNKFINGNLINFSKQFLDNYSNGYCVEMNSNYTPAPAYTIAQQCSENKNYIGYISSIKTREYKFPDGNKTLFVRLVCHLIIDDIIGEFCFDLPPTISSNSRLAILLINFGIPVFNFSGNIELDCLIGKPISATLVKYDKGKTLTYYVQSIEPRIA